MTTTAPAPLPSEIRTLIDRIARRTRLRRAERVEIARELEAHFNDGLAAGRSAADLIRDFGDPVASAKRLRAGALSKRSPLDRAFRKTMIAALWVIGSFMGLYAIAAVYLGANPPVISFDPVATYVATIPTAPADQQAWPHYKRGLVALSDPGSKPATFKSWGDDLAASLPGRPGWDARRALLIERRSGIDAILAGSKWAVLGYTPVIGHKPDDAEVHFYDPAQAQPTQAEFPMLYLLLPHLSSLRTAAKFAAADAFLSIESGDSARFTADIDALLAIAIHAEEGDILISQLVGTAIRHLAFNRVVMALEWMPERLSDADLEHVANSLRSIPPTAYECNLSTEALCLLDLLQRTYSDDGDGDGYFNASAGMPALREIEAISYPGPRGSDQGKALATLSMVASPIAAFTFASRKEIVDLQTEFFRKTEEMSRRPLWQQDFKHEAEFEAMMRASAMAEVKWTIPRLLMPAVAKAAQSRRLGEGYCQSALFAIAMEQYRRAHGAWPATLAELAPAFLPAAPVDPYDGKPLRYRVVGGTPVAWSVGRDLRDDGGSETDWIWFVGDDDLKRWQTP